MNFEQLFGSAIMAPNPLAQLHKVVVGLLEQGFSHAELLAQLEKYRDTLRAAERETDEDVILDVMDFLTGWCSPHMRLVRHEVVCVAVMPV